MARAATTADAFNAVAEPRRRQILDVLAGGERPVNDLVQTLGLAQPQVSKHLRVLREDVADVVSGRLLADEERLGDPSVRHAHGEQPQHLLLAGGERPVNDLVRTLGLAQPQVSKHLRVLREVGAVDVRDHGRQRLYRLNGHALKPIHDWVKAYESTWAERFEQLDVVLDDLKKEQQGDGSGE